MEATKQLREEHQGILLMLKILDKVCQKLDDGEKVSPDHLDQILEFIKIFVEKCHHKKEESILFPAMLNVQISQGSDLVGAILKEHSALHDIVKNLNDGIREYQAGNLAVKSTIIESIRIYTAMLTQHVEQEDKVVFPLAEKHLTEETQEKLYFEFEKMEINQIGAGKHEQLHRVLDHLSKVYLS